MTQFISALHISELKLSVRGQVIRADDWQIAEDAHAMLEQVKKLKENAVQAAQLLREQAKEQGFEQGLAQASAVFAGQLARLAQKEADQLRLNEQRITQLALAIVQRLLGQLPVEKIMPVIVTEVVSAAIADQFLSIRVPNAAKASVQAELAKFRQLHPTLLSIEVLGDDSLEAGSCVVASEAGEVRGNLNAQFEAIKSALLDASASVA